MSESTERATRRDLRRAVGTEAVSIIEQQGVALAHHAFVLNQHTQQLHEVQKRIDGLADAQRETHPPGARMVYLVYDIQTDTWRLPHVAQDVIRSMQGRTFLSRLRWLFIGR